MTWYCPNCQHEAESHDRDCACCGYLFRGEHDDEPTGEPEPGSPAAIMRAWVAECGR